MALGCVYPGTSYPGSLVCRLSEISDLEGDRVGVWVVVCGGQLDPGCGRSRDDVPQP